MTTRKRRFGSIAKELVKKSREAMLTAVQVFNNPQIEFKSELFIVTTVIAWTYLLHAYYKKSGIDYRQVDLRHKGKRKRYLITRYGAVRHWNLEECLAQASCPISDAAKKNLFFLIGIRHEIEHQMTMRIDDQLSAKFMASALNFNTTIKRHFGNGYALEAEQAFSIQFSSIDKDTAKTLLVQADLPTNIRSFLVEFDNGMTQEEYNDPRFSYRVALVQKITNSKTAADQLLQLVPPGSEVSDAMNKAILKETEKVKYRPKTIVDQMHAEGFVKFNLHKHTLFWRERDAKNPKHQYGTAVEGQWYWYEAWLTQVRQYCTGNESVYKPASSAPPTSSSAAESS
jgi:hypothetical protein